MRHWNCPFITEFGYQAVHERLFATTTPGSPAAGQRYPCDVDHDAEVRANRRGIKSRRRVLDAAESLMADHGYAGTSMPKIVAAAGIPLSSIYHFFGSKEGVLGAVMERGAQRMADAIVPPPPDTDPLAALTLLLDQLQQLIGDHPQFFSLVTATAETAASDSKAAAMARDIRDLALRMMRDRIADVLTPRPDDHAAEQLARFVRAAIDGALLAERADDVSLDSVLKPLPTAVLAIHQQWSAHTESND